MQKREAKKHRSSFSIYTIISAFFIMFTFAQYIVYPFYSVGHVYAEEENSLLLSSDYTLEEDTEVDSLTIEDGTLDLNGYTLTVTGNVSQTGGVIDLNQGTLKVEGNVSQSGGTLDTNKGKLLIDGSYSLTNYSHLYMLTDQDYILVKKDFTLDNYLSYYDDIQNLLEAGTLEVKGNFTQKGSSDSFVPTDTHKVILSGGAKQTISFINPSYSRFNILELTKPLPIGYTLSTAVKWNELKENTTKQQSWTGGGSLQISSNWTLPYDIEIASLTMSEGTVDLNGHSLTITGNLTQSGGTININQGTLKIRGNISQSGGTLDTNKGKLLIDGSYSLTNYSHLYMLTDQDYILVKKDFTLDNYLSYYDDIQNLLEAGTLEVKGNFTQKGSSDSFVPTDTHKVVLSGDAKQTISFVNPSYSRFNILEITKPLATGYTFATKVNWVKLIQTKQTIAVTALGLDKTALSLTVGDAPVTLKATVQPSNATNQKVTWSSSNTSVANVDANGTITPKAAGTAVITATTEDGKKTATATVTVKNKTVSPTSVKLNTTSLSLTVGDDPTTLQSTVLPSNATNKNVTWTSSNPSVATVDENGAVTAISAGTATITVTTEDGKKTASAKVTVTAEQSTTDSYTLDDFVNDSNLFNDVLGSYTLDQIQITLPSVYIQKIKVTRNDALKVSTFEIQTDEEHVERVDIVTAGKTYALTAQGDGLFKRSISGLVKGSEFIVKAYDENGKLLEDSIQRVIPMDYTANVPTQANVTLQMLMDDIDLFNSLLDSYTLDQMQVVLPKIYVQDVQTTYSSLATKIVLTADTAITKATVDIKGKVYTLTSKGNGKFERAIAGLTQGTTFKVKVYTLDGSLVEEKSLRVK